MKVNCIHLVHTVLVIIGDMFVLFCRLFVKTKDFWDVLVAEDGLESVFYSED